MTIDLTALETQDAHRFEVTADPDGAIVLTLSTPDQEAIKAWECRDTQAAERVALRQARALAEQRGATLTIVLAADGQERVFTVTGSSATELPAALPTTRDVADVHVDVEPAPNVLDGDTKAPATAMVAASPHSSQNEPTTADAESLVDEPVLVEAESPAEDRLVEDRDADALDDDLRVSGSRPTAPRQNAGSRLRTAAAALEGHAPAKKNTPRMRWLGSSTAQVEAPALNLPKAPPIEQAADDLERPERRFALPWARTTEIKNEASSTTSTTSATSQLPARSATPDSATAAPAARAQRTASSAQHTPTGRVTFLPGHDPAAQPATRGWRGALNLMGAHLRPDARELAYRDDEAAAATAWTGPRTIAVVNGKGGAGKTPTTAMLAAVFAHYGSSTLAWDNNPLRGTLGWRTEQAHHDATILDLLEETGRLVGPSARAADLTAFLHHQRADRFDVLRSQPRRLASDRRVLGPDVDEIHRIISKFFRLIIMDSGNDESDPMWRAMIKHTDQLVVVTTTQAGTAEAGALLLDSLSDRGGHGARLARDAVAVVTQADRSAKPAAVRTIEDGYRDLVAPDRVVTIPYDPGMVEGALRLRELRSTTQRAWLAAAATIACAMPQDVEANNR